MIIPVPADEASMGRFSHHPHDLLRAVGRFQQITVRAREVRARRAEAAVVRPSVGVPRTDSPARRADDLSIRVRRERDCR